MSGLEAGYNYPDIVRAGIHLVLDPPADYAIRVDPEGEAKREERRQRNRAWAEEKRQAGMLDFHAGRVSKLPPLRTIHLQWLDASYPARGEPVWRDTHVHIDLEKRRFQHIEGWLLGRRHDGSGTIGVMVFAAPVLLAISPYLYVRAKLYRSKERKHGMSRHGIVLLEKLKGQLDAETEALLAAVLRNEWRIERKLGRAVRFDEALQVLQRCDLTMRVGLHDFGETPVLMGDFVWHDDEGDMTAHVQFIGDQVHFAHVLRSEFEDQEARALIGWYRSRSYVDLEKD